MNLEYQIIRVGANKGLAQHLSDLRIEKNWPEIVRVDKLDEFRTALEQVDFALVAIDWSFELKLVNQFFELMQEHAKHTFFIKILYCPKQDHRAVSVGLEHRCDAIVHNPISAEKLKLEIGRVMEEQRISKEVLVPITKARSLMNTGEAKKADAILTETHLKHPTHIETAISLCENSLEMGDPKKCQIIAEKLLLTHHTHPRLLHLKAKALLSQNKHQEAIEVFEEANLVNPNNVERLITMGKVALQVEDLDTAESSFKRVREIDRSDRQAIVGLGTTKLLSGDIDAALKLIQHKLTGKELASLFNTAAVLAVFYKNIEKAFSLYQVAKQSLEKDKYHLARVAYNEALAHFKMGRYAEAKLGFEMALDNDPNFENAKINLQFLQKKVSGEPTPVISPMRKKNDAKTNEAKQAEVSMILDNLLDDME